MTHPSSVASATGAPAGRDEIVGLSRASGPDPFPGDPDGAPSEASDENWFYPWGQCELALLHRMVRESSATTRHVDYAGNYGVLADAAEFRWVGPRGARQVEVVGGPETPPCVVLDSTTDRVEVRLPGEGWGPAVLHRRHGQGPPHAPVPATSTLTLALDQGAGQLPAPVVGRPVLVGEPGQVRTGESSAEVMSGEADQEVRHTLVRRSEGRWSTEHATGFSHLRVADPAGRPWTGEVVVEVEHPAPARRGAFVCSDEMLNRIWSISAYTLRVCSRELLMDGIRRDRLPWMGDAALSTLTSAFASGDNATLHRTLVALGQPRDGYVNGIADYTLWWVIAARWMVDYFDASEDVAALARQADHLLRGMAEHTGEQGLLEPPHLPDQFTPHVLIDWGVDRDRDQDLTALQLMWCWAQRSASELLAMVDDPAAPGWAARAEALEAVITREGLDPAVQGWREHLGGPARGAVYAPLLATLAGIGQGATGAHDARGQNPSGRPRTPFMTAMALLARGRQGDRAGAVRDLRRWWGEMVDAGAQSFWEEFPDGAGDDLEMYGRPFGRSRCHAWSSGPVALLPELVLGLRPRAPGWSVFSVDVQLGELTWASAVVPVPTGEIVVHATPNLTVIEVPPGTVLHRPGEPDLSEGRWSLTPKEPAA